MGERLYFHFHITYVPMEYFKAVMQSFPLDENVTSSAGDRRGRLWRWNKLAHGVLNPANMASRTLRRVRQHGGRAKVNEFGGGMRGAPEVQCTIPSSSFGYHWNLIKNLKRIFPNFPPLFNKFLLIMTISLACSRWGHDGRERQISQKSTFAPCNGA